MPVISVRNLIKTYTVGEVIVRALQSLSEAIAERGGQRRARPYIASQLRRLDG